ncbi:hypothetical protein [Brevundimonas sp. FT23042]|uniref:hypothetical protein n=1 Tax=Brevundimonas sp. FT23042 TaxID=3393749 RepID=UPI003B5889DF
MIVHLLTKWAFGEGPTPSVDCFEHPADLHALLALTHEISPRLSGQSEGYEARLAEARRRLMERHEASLRTLRG